jgi:hypothetical protein
MRNGRLAAIDIQWEEKCSGTSRQSLEKCSGTSRQSLEKCSGTSRQSLERTMKYYIKFMDPTSLDSNLELENKAYHLLK